MRYTIYLFIATTLLAAGCMNGSLVATDTENASPGLIPEAPKTVPFHAHEENTIIVVSQVGDILTAEFPGVIEGDHIGQGTILTTSQVNFGVFPFDQTGEGVITSASGAELNWEFAGTAIPGSAPGDVIFSGTFTFEGGTGRFADASGGGTYAGTANTIAAVGQFDMDGVISK